MCVIAINTDAVLIIGHMICEEFIKIKAPENCQVQGTNYILYVT